MASVTLANFQLINSWKPAFNSVQWREGGPKYLIDASTGQKYWNEPKNSVRFKCFLLILGTPYRSFACLFSKYSLSSCEISFFFPLLDRQTNRKLLFLSRKIERCWARFIKSCNDPCCFGWPGISGHIWNIYSL